MALGTNRARVLDVLAFEIDDLLAAISSVKYAHQLTTSRGSSLDEIGYMFNIIRTTDETDADFRILLSQLISIYTAAGTKSAIVAFLAVLLDIEETDIRLYETAPGNVMIFLPTTFLDQANYINGLLTDIMAAGVVVTLIWSETFWDSPDTLYDSDDIWV